MRGIRQIRCYGSRFDPDDFKDKGWRGWWIRVLNRLRVSLEFSVIYHVLRVQAERGGDLVDLNSVLKTYQEDVAQERQTHFKQPTKFDPPINSSVEGHIKEMHRQGSLESPSDLTARILDRYAASKRSRRYANARGRYVIQEVNTDPIDATETHPEEEPTHVRTAEQRGRILPISPELATELEFTEIDVARAAERLQSVEQIRKSADAAEEHQRSVLS